MVTDDVYDASTRRRVMQSIRKTDTKPEKRVRSALHRMGLRFRLHRRDLPGVPDIVLPRHRVVIFVHGCFWHQHSCKLGKFPKSNRSYWVPKLTGNQARDAEHVRSLQDAHWSVVVVWECETFDDTILSTLLRRRLPSHVTRALRS